MPTLQETINVPGAVAADDVTVTLELWDGTPGDGVAAGVRIGGPAYAYGASWSITNVVANTAIEPAGTVYRATRTWPGLDDPLADYISMPASGGPYRVDELLTDPPDDLPTLEPTNELDVAEITTNLTLTGFNGFNILPVPGMTVTKPEEDRPCWSRAQVWMEHASAAN